MLRGRIYNRTKKAVGRPENNGDKSAPLKTAESLANNYGVSERTIKNDGQFARAVEDLKKADPTIEQRVHSGKVAKQSVVAAAKVMAHPRSRIASPQATNRICATTEAVMDGPCHRENGCGVECTITNQVDALGGPPAWPHPEQSVIVAQPMRLSKGLYHNEYKESTRF